MKKYFYRLSRQVLPLVLVMLISLPVLACTTCNRPLQAAIFDESFLKVFFYMLLPFLFIGAAVYRLNKLK
ncbi:hypothetical protein [Pontibacter sp. BAB1700]|uniref:hypothetical protein n=1 Tax=Pontibacter sp. BAB1700 TaxID=1144253 RepID=UPI00026BBCF4|nr:hypothetical protein [Pontibacter sp. BAB1700]EJF11467.1 hypothetical protein O71_02767 [Pontibacter sp. BAB1700]